MKYNEVLFYIEKFFLKQTPNSEKKISLDIGMYSFDVLHHLRRNVFIICKPKEENMINGNEATI